MVPVITTLATGLPEMVPKSALEATDILAAPPRNLPSSEVAISVKNSPPPVANRTCPNRMKATTIVATMVSGIPSRELGSMYRWTAILDQEIPRALNIPGKR